MKYFKQISTLIFSLAAIFAAPAVHADDTVMPEGSYIALCYHNVEDADPDQRYDGVSVPHLVEQFDWLKHEGYHVVSMSDLIAAHNGKKKLPPKAVLLTFDDGYESFYTRVYPMLKTYHYPATIAVVDQWMEGSAAHPGDHVKYGETTMPRSAFLTWAQLREMKKSGLVEVVSHTHALHYGLDANPQGNKEPAVISAHFHNGAYESQATYAKRIDADLAASSANIKKEVGMAPRVIVWPYGAYNGTARAAAKRHGMPYAMSLDDGLGNVRDLSNIPRFLVKNDPDMEAFAVDMRQLIKPQPLRVVKVDLDDIYSEDPEQLHQNISDLISRVHGMKISTVVVKAFSNTTNAVYFPNRELPVRADIFNRVSWQLNTRDDVKVLGWLPPAGDLPRAKLARLYEDFGRHCPVDGMLFADNAASMSLTNELAAEVRKYREPLPLVREIDANAVLNGPDYDTLLKSYDYAAVVVSPEDEEAVDAVTVKATNTENGLHHSIFMLQSPEAASADSSAISAEEVGGQMHRLLVNNALNFGFSEHDFAGRTDDESQLHKDFSLQNYPYLP